MKHISLQEFVNTLFNGHAPEQERVCLTHKMGSGAESTWANYPATARRLAKYREGEGAWYVGVSTYLPPVDVGGRAEFPRDRDHAVNAWAMVCDDVGTKCAPPPLAPSWVIETSEGNTQWGYLLEPVDMRDPALRGRYEATQRALADAGYADRGALGLYRVVRVPGSLHRTGFVARVTVWEPDRIYELDELIDGMGVTLGAVKPIPINKTPAAGDPSRLAELADPVLDWLAGQNMVLPGGNRKFVDILCPWRSEHTSEGDTAGYTPKGYERPDFDHAFSCFHEHCQGRNKGSLLEWVAAQGGPDLRPKTAQLRRLAKEDLPDCVWTSNGTPRQSQLPTLDNVRWVVEQLGVLVRHNLMSGATEVSHPLAPCEHDNDRGGYLIVRDELFRLGVSAEGAVADAIEHIGLQHPYHPMADWLDGLPEWDGVDRIAELAGTVETSTQLWPVYLKRWLVQVIAAVREWDKPQQRPHVLTFSGPQGCGKSTWFGALVPARFFKGEAELHLDRPSGRDQQMVALSRPVVELAEIDAAFRKSDISALRSFLTRDIDEIRAPYGRAAIRRPRCTVFCGSVNGQSFLTDSEGTRRWWPVAVTKCDARHGIDLRQLWAQVSAVWASGEGYFLNELEERHRVAEASGFRAMTLVSMLYQQWFTEALLETDQGGWEWMTAGDVADLIGLPLGVINPGSLAELGGLLDADFGPSHRGGGKRKARLVPGKRAAGACLRLVVKN
jgi:hypothetical protein